MTKLVMGHIVCMGPDDEEAIPYDEAVIHIEGDEDSEITINCHGALRLAPTIVNAVNSHAGLIDVLQDIIKNSREKFAVERAIEGMRAVVSRSQETTND